MNFNKSFLRITNKCPLQIPYKSRVIQTLSSIKHSTVSIQKSKPSVQNYNRLLPRPNPFSFYSSLANEEEIKAKVPNSVINVPTLQFANVTFDQRVSHTELYDSLQICDSVDEQMETLASTLTLSPDDIENRIYFTKVMESLLKPFFSNIKIQIFGSTLNGFGFKGCDLDMSFHTYVDQKEEISSSEFQDVPLVSEVLCGKVSPAYISSLSPKDQLVFIHSVLLEFYKESEEPTIFINAHVPLIRFYHDKYGLKCDLTCENKIALANTKLLYLFGRLDERVVPLVMTIRYWAKHVELIGKGLMFNTYTISLLVFHFLQTRKDPILPSAEYLMSLSDSLSIQDMDDYSFLEIQSNIPPSKNNQTLSELLKEFFLYYLFFDFTRVICPLIGDSVPREEFFKTCSKRFRMNSICIQDPMDVKHNVAELVEFKFCKKFSSEVMIACHLFQNESALTPAPSKWGISSLLDKIDENQFKTSNNNKMTSFTVPHITKQINKDIALKGKDHFTAESLLYLLRHVLLFECRRLEKREVVKSIKEHDEDVEKTKRMFELKNKYKAELKETFEKENRKVTISLTDLQVFSDALMLEEFEQLSSENELLSCFECRATKNTWLGRDHISLDSLPTDIFSDLIERERYISLETSKQNELVLNYVKSAKKPDPFVFFCECYVSHKFPNSLFLNFRPFQKSNVAPLLGIFLKDYLSKVIRNLNEGS